MQSSGENPECIPAMHRYRHIIVSLLGGLLAKNLYVLRLAFFVALVVGNKIVDIVRQQSMNTPAKPTMHVLMLDVYTNTYHFSEDCTASVCSTTMYINQTKHSSYVRMPMFALQYENL